MSFEISGISKPDFKKSPDFEKVTNCAQICRDFKVSCQKSHFNVNLYVPLDYLSFKSILLMSTIAWLSVYFTYTRNLRCIH